MIEEGEEPDEEYVDDLMEEDEEEEEEGEEGEEEVVDELMENAAVDDDQDMDGEINHHVHDINFNGEEEGQGEEQQ